MASYTWNVYNKLATVVDSSTKTLTYDAFGRLAEKQDGSTYAEILYSPVGRIGQMNGQTSSDILIPLPGGSEYETSPGYATFAHKDWLGSVRMTSGKYTRNVVSSSAYAPFGESYAGSLNRFTGDQADITTASGGLQDTPARELRVRQGRWISPDRAGLKAVNPTNPQTWNRYAYVLNAPLSHTDPSGLCEQALINPRCRTFT